MSSGDKRFTHSELSVPHRFTGYSNESVQKQMNEFCCQWFSNLHTNDPQLETGSRQTKSKG